MQLKEEIPDSWCINAPSFAYQALLIFAFLHMQPLLFLLHNYE